MPRKVKFNYVDPTGTLHQIRLTPPAAAILNEQGSKRAQRSAWLSTAIVKLSVALNGPTQFVDILQWFEAEHDMSVAQVSEAAIWSSFGA